jgi:hypothetical protein
VEKTSTDALKLSELRTQYFGLLNELDQFKLAGVPSQWQQELSGQCWYTKREAYSLLSGIRICRPNQAGDSSHSPGEQRLAAVRRYLTSEHSGQYGPHMGPPRQPPGQCVSCRKLLGSTGRRAG